MLKRLNRWVLAILLLALALRLIGIMHGFPFIFHPDEPTVVRSALGVRFFPNPQHFDWPHLYIYLNYFLYMLFGKVRTLFEILNLKFLVSTYAPIIWDDNLIFYLITRTCSALLGAFTVIPVYLAGKKLFGEKAGIYSALVLAVIPFHVWHSHYSLVDVPMVFFLAWVVYFCTRILFENGFTNFIWAGVFTGLAASTKYNGGLVAFLVPLALFVRLIREKYKFSQPQSFLPVIRNLIISAGCAVLAFVLGTPYAVLDFKTFIRTDSPKGALWQFSNVGSVSFAQQIGKFFEAFLHKFPSDLSPVFVGVFVVVVIWIFGKFLLKNKNLLLRFLFLLLPAVLLLFYISGFSKNRSHYYMVAYPFIALAVGSFVSIVETTFKTFITKFALVFVVFFLPFYMSLQGAITFAFGDTRIQLYDWMLATVSVEDVLVYDGDDIQEIIWRFPDNTVKKSKHITVAELLRLSGFLVISTEGGEGISIFGGKVPSDVLFSEAPVFVVIPSVMRGPSIQVYKLPVLK